MARGQEKLAEYNRKRDFDKTTEPAGKAQRNSKNSRLFTVQKHDARRLHYDLRLEHDGVLLSWAVTRGPSLDPSQKRLAVRTEDHPLSYAEFEGTIPQGEYGGGTVMLWDKGEWQPHDDPARGLAEGKLSFTVHAERMKGDWALIRMRKRGEKRENWLLIKEKDDFAGDADTLTEKNLTSVKTGRNLDEIASAKAAKKATKQTKTSKKQGALPTPKFQAPQLATLVDEAPDGDAWLNEVKFDGYRCLIATGNDGVRCYTRSGLDWTEKFAPVAEAAKALTSTVLIDGEVVAEDGDTPSQFSALQDALKHGGDMCYFAFDLVQLDGEDLTDEPLLTRKERLKALIATLPSGSAIKYSEHVQGSGPEVYEAICKAGKEGIVAKRADAPYRHKRSRDWLKIKCTKRQEFVIGGYSRSDKKSRPFSSLLLGTFDGGKLLYRGRVGTGFDADELDRLKGIFAKLEQKQMPFEDVPKERRRGVVWLKPQLVAEVDFTEFTADNHVRHGVYLGLREDKQARKVAMETPKKPPSGSRVEVQGIPLSNPDRVVFPDQGLTKIELARYYEIVAERMLPHVAGRPLSLVRCPQGRSKACFFQKHASDGFPKAIRKVPIVEKDGGKADYLTVPDIAGIVAAVQMGTLEFHIWGAKNKSLEKPERLVFDLDPDPGVDFNGLKEAAFDLRDRLADIGLQTWPLVTGGKGVHVIAPLRARAEWPEVKAFARAVAQALADEEPERFIATASKAKRKGRIFIDWLRNERGATAIAPYSTRARAGAPVATPVSWQELKTLEAANVFSVERVIERMERPDPWADYEAKQSLTKAMLKKLGVA